MSKAGNSDSFNVLHPETELFLPSQAQSQLRSNRFHLPDVNSTVSVDEYLSEHPFFFPETRRILISKRPLAISSVATLFSPSIGTSSSSSPKATSPPIIYIHQREVGYISSHQYGGNGAILMSDAATTCHVIALRSTSSSTSSENIVCGNGTSGNKVLGSLCHIDSTKNESCIRRMVARHASFHNANNMHKGSEGFHMEIHIMGGFRDNKNQSSAITSHVIRLFAVLAAEYKTKTTNKITMELSTCAVTSLNDESFSLSKDNDGRKTDQPRPISGGMSLDVNNGTIALLSTVHESLRGPAATLRRVRTWSPGASHLLTVHTEEEDGVIIPPFEFSPFSDMELFMSLPDKVMLQYLSTSPECEPDDFCDLLRESFVFLRDVTFEDVFNRSAKKVDVPDSGDDDGGGEYSGICERYEAVVYRWKEDGWLKVKKI